MAREDLRGAVTLKVTAVDACSCVSLAPSAFDLASSTFGTTFGEVATLDAVVKRRHLVLFVASLDTPGGPERRQVGQLSRRSPSGQISR